MIPTITRLSPKQAIGIISDASKCQVLEHGTASLLLAAIETLKDDRQRRKLLVDRLSNIPIIVQTKGSYDPRRKADSIRSVLASIGPAPSVIRIDAASDLEPQMRSIVQNEIVGKRNYGETAWLNQRGEESPPKEAIRRLTHSQNECFSFRKKNGVVSLYHYTKGVVLDHVVLTTAGMSISTHKTTTVRKEGDLLHLGGVTVSLALTDLQKRPPLISHTVADPATAVSLMAVARQKIEDLSLHANIVINTEQGWVERVEFLSV